MKMFVVVESEGGWEQQVHFWARRAFTTIEAAERYAEYVSRGSIVDAEVHEVEVDTPEDNWDRKRSGRL